MGPPMTKPLSTTIDLMRIVSQLCRVKSAAEYEYRAEYEYDTKAGRFL